MKICLYLEFYHFWNGILFKRIGTGLLSSYENQKRLLGYLAIPFAERWDDSCDILQVNTPWLKSIYLIKKAKAKEKKVIILAHVTVEDAMQVFRFMPLIHPLLKYYLKYAYNLADFVFCPSEYTKSLLVAYGISLAKLHVQSNGVDTRVFFRDEARRASFRKSRRLENIVIGSLGLVIPRKGIDTFLFLARTFPETQFFWFGKIYSSLLVEPLPDNLPGNVSFTGYIDDIVAGLNALDIFIFPSYEENQGMAILEAAAVGLPILVRDIPVYREWLHHGINCLKAKNDAEFAEHIRMLLGDVILRERLGKGAKKLAASEDITASAEKVRLLYENLISAS